MQNTPLHQQPRWWVRWLRPVTRRSGLWFAGVVILGTLFCGLTASGADGVNTTAAMPPIPLPEVGLSLLRLLGGLALVLALFLGGVWVARHWRRLAPNHLRVSDLKIIEVKPLGGRQSLCIVGYRRQRLLVASSPTGVSLLTELPDSVTDDPAPAPLDFAAAFRQVLNRGK